jgi:hypothetical protein
MNPATRDRTDQTAPARTRPQGGPALKPRIRPRLTCWCALVALLIPVRVVHSGTAFVPDPPERAREILPMFCYGCHGQDGRNEGGLNDVTDLARLVASKRVVTSRLADSKRLGLVTDGRLPPQFDRDDVNDAASALARSTAEQVVELRAWIEAGARPPADPAATPRPFVSDDDVRTAVTDGLAGLAPPDRRHTRVFTITHLANAARNDDQLLSYRHALAKLINRLSWNRKI